jgi:hypothetical protein
MGEESRWVTRDHIMQSVKHLPNILRFLPGAEHEGENKNRKVIRIGSEKTGLSWSYTLTLEKSFSAQVVRNVSPK